jgi:hypothetical protein
MNNKDFFNLDNDFYLEICDGVYIAEEQEEVTLKPLFSAHDFFASWYLSSDVEDYLLSFGLPKYALRGACRAICQGFNKDIDLTNDLLDYLLSLTLSGNDLEIYTQKSPKLIKYGYFRDLSKSKTLKGSQVSLLANVIRNALLGVAF